MDDLFYKIALTRTPKIGVVKARQLIAYCGGVRAIFTASRNDLQGIPGINEDTIEQVVQQTGFKEAEHEMWFIEKNQVQVLFYLDDNYPRRLRHFSDAPLLLYYRGTADLNGLRHVGIVGTRKPSEYGRLQCESLVMGLQTYQPLIVSGLAYGIDVIAHRKALELDLPTVGVLGHGFGQIYPAAHQQIAERMLERGGLLTEFPSWMGPDREHFPMRNRIVAGLSDALVVVETPRKGGSIITARYAKDYQKNVFAYPGRVYDRLSEGCHQLIKTQQATLLDNADDVARACRWEKRDIVREQQQRVLFAQLTPQEQSVIDLLTETDALGIDHISYAAQLNNGSLSAILLGLEFSGLVKELPGKRYTLLR